MKWSNLILDSIHFEGKEREEWNSHRKCDEFASQSRLYETFFYKIQPQNFAIWFGTWSSKLTKMTIVLCIIFGIEKLFDWSVLLDTATTSTTHSSNKLNSFNLNWAFKIVQ